VTESYNDVRSELLELIRRYVDLVKHDSNHGGDLMRRRLSAVSRWREGSVHLDWEWLEFEDQLRKVDTVQNEFRAWIQDNREEPIETLAKRAGLELESSRTDERMLEFVKMHRDDRRRKLKYEVPTLKLIISRLDKTVRGLEKIVDGKPSRRKV
jgi:hypothetical protein